MKTKFKTRDLTMIAMMGAICCILLHIDFPLPFLPPFMNFDLAGLVEIIGGFAMGPLQAVCIILVKNPAEAGNRGYLLRIYRGVAEFPAQLCVCAASRYHVSPEKI